MKRKTILVTGGKWFIAYNSSIDMKIDIALKLGETILDIELWGSESTSQSAKNVADEAVDWNADSNVAL